MAQTSDQIRRELEITRARMGQTLAALEQKMNPKHVVDNYPLAALGVAFGAGVLLGGIRDQETTRAVRTQFRRGRERVTDSTSHAIDEIVQGVQASLVAAGTVKLSQLLDSLTRRYPPSNQSSTAVTPVEFADDSYYEAPQPAGPPPRRRW